MDAMQDLQTAIGAEPSEAAMVAALQVADAYRAQVAGLERQVENLKRSNVALRLADDQIRAKAELIDHAFGADGGSLVLCRETLDGKRRWSFEPLASLEEALQVMEADLAAAAEEAECSACLGTVEGRHEGAGCAACGGSGY